MKLNDMESLDNSRNRTSAITERMDIGSAGFNEFQAILLNESRDRSDQQKVIVKLLALKFKMEDYVRSDSSKMILVGQFLKLHLVTFKIRQNKFADYIGLKPSNLTKLIKGERSLSHELALTIGTIFGNDPMLWLDIQDKNKLDELAKNKSDKIQSYSLSELMSV